MLDSPLYQSVEERRVQKFDTFQKKIFQKRRTSEPKNTFGKANLIFKMISKIDFPSPSLTKNVLQTMESETD